MPHSLYTLNWRKAFLPQVVEYLGADCGDGFWDLSRVLLVVPTSQTGRRLRELLARKTAESGTGVLSPRIVTPDWLVNQGLGDKLAGVADLAATWTALLLAADLESLRSLFPIDPPKRDAGWALGLAQQLAKLQASLAESGLDFSLVAERVAGTDLEPERWAALASLETQLRARLGERGLCDPSQEKRETALKVRVPEGIERVVLAGVLDPMPLAITILERWTESIPVEVLVHGDPEDPLHDTWGRADKLRVEQRSLPLRSDTVHLRVFKDQIALTSFVAQLANGYRDSRPTLGLCTADPRLLAPIAARLSDDGFACHDPAGRSLSRSAVGKLVRVLASLCLDDATENVALVLRDPYLGDYAVRERKWVSDSAGLLTALDKLRLEHLPQRLPECLAFARVDDPVSLTPALEWLSEARRRLNEGVFANELEALLAVLLSGCKISLQSPEAASAEEAVQSIRTLLSDLARVEARNAALPGEFWPRLLLQVLSLETQYLPKSPDAWDLQGWLETLAEDAPHLVIAGFNEGIVPESIRGDLFLPDLLREKLGMKSNTDRFLRDKLLLETLLQSRAEGGRVDLLIPKVSSDGDPLQPSRLLFACPDEELVARALQLFAPLPETRQPPRRSIAWKLKPLPVLAPRSLSPSAIRSYLDCPFRYYLEYGLRLKPVDPAKRDLDALDFGNLCHKSLERLAKDKAMGEVREPSVIAAHLEASLKEEATAKFGHINSFALRIQLEAAAARLRAAAEVEAQLRDEGWRIFDTERPWNMEVRGRVFGGTIDRIDRHPDGRWRVVDYKTSDSGTDPESAHWGSCSQPGEWILPESLFQVSGKQKRWKDLQLPLYLLALRQLLGAEARAGYFVLPRTKEDTGLRLWESLSPELLLSAETCALAVFDAITANRFWPPAPSPRWRDELGQLFPDSVPLDVDETAFAALKGGAK